jgi:hypothetical protein
MERVAWTDERLDDLSRRMDAGFERVDGELRVLGGRIDALGDRLDGRIDSIGDSLGARIDRLDGRFDALQVTLVRVGGGVIVGLVGVIAAVYIRG